MTPEEEARFEREQADGTEVAALGARTAIDDTIGKLWAIRQQLRVPLPDDLPALLDDVEALVEKAIDLAFDEEAEALSTVIAYPAPHPYPEGSDAQLGTGSESLGFCSCGGVFL